LARLPINRRKFIGLAAAAGVVALGADAFVVDPNFPVVIRQEISLARWPEQLDGFTIALLSDFHYDRVFSIHPIHAAIGMVNNLRPDLVALTGDFVSMPWIGSHEKAAAAAEPCARLLRQLNAPQGLWAVLGNHDYFTDPDHVTAALTAEKIPVLANQSVPIERNGERFWLAGVDDVLGKAARLDRTLRNVPKDEPVVLMVHEPDYADKVARYPVDLQLSGHSHGGQVRVPLVGPLYLPELARKYVWGLYKVGELTLYTNAGLGTVQIPVRFNCAPEITLLSIRRAVGR
jgi:predicted MPP superfamily phosphohydrolase